MLEIKSLQRPSRDNELYGIVNPTRELKKILTTFLECLESDERIFNEIKFNLEPFKMHKSLIILSLRSRVAAVTTQSSLPHI